MQKTGWQIFRMMHFLSSVNIPATHDTGTAGVVEDDIPQVSITSCQNLYYDEQLNMGARSFDIRANATKDDASVADVKIVHGGELWQCQEKTEVILHYSQSSIPPSAF